MSNTTEDYNLTFSNGIMAASNATYTYVGRYNTTLNYDDSSSTITVTPNSSGTNLVYNVEGDMPSYTWQVFDLGRNIKRKKRLSNYEKKGL